MTVFRDLRDRKALMVLFWFGANAAAVIAAVIALRWLIEGFGA